MKSHFIKKYLHRKWFNKNTILRRQARFASFSLNRSIGNNNQQQILCLQTMRQTVLKNIMLLKLTIRYEFWHLIKLKRTTKTVQSLLKFSTIFRPR